MGHMLVPMLINKERGNQSLITVRTAPRLASHCRYQMGLARSTTLSYKMAENTKYISTPRYTPVKDNTHDPSNLNEL